MGEVGRRVAVAVVELATTYRSDGVEAIRHRVALRVGAMDTPSLAVVGDLLSAVRREQARGQKGVTRERLIEALADDYELAVSARGGKR